MNNDTDCTALVAVSNSRKEIVVTYRGTANLWNVVQDLELFEIKYANRQSDIKIHTGFYKATMSLYNKVGYFACDLQIDWVLFGGGGGWKLLSKMFT